MKYFASCSFGKDSVATVLLAIENNEPLDGILFNEIVFDHKRNISGEIPEHIEWVYNTAIPTFERMGVSTKVIKSEKDYMYFFTNTVGGGKYKGKLYGFPMGGRCIINRDCKVGAIKKYLRTIGEEYTQYIGIAIDEPKRLARLKDNQISLLAKYGYTEQMAMELCRKYNLVSPIYETGTRGGCWFCPNAKISALANFRNKHPELWQELEILSHTENLCTTGFKWGLTLQQVNEKIDIFNKKQKEAMNIREMQLSLFDPDPDTIVGGGIVQFRTPAPQTETG